MGRAKLLLRIVGIASAVAGLTCLPVGYGINPARDVSVFANLADRGMFIALGIALMAVGAIIVVVSCVLPGEEPDDLL